MSNISISYASFVATGRNVYGDEVGTVEVNGKTCRAQRTKYCLYVHGFVGRYRSSSKAWQASVSTDERGLGVHVDFGRDDRSSRFNKQNAISYEPALFDTLTNAKVWDAS